MKLFGGNCRITILNRNIMERMKIGTETCFLTVQNGNILRVPKVVHGENMILHINSYLFWGYIPFQDDTDFFRIEPSPVQKPRIDVAAELLDQGISNLFSSGDYHVLPMSGGLDSRLLLCELLQFTTSDKIRLFTFGIPGSFDYEIPSMISKKLGIKIEKVDLNKVLLSTSDLLESITETNRWTYLFDSFYNRIVFKRFGKNVCYWSGFMGNNLAGEHLDWYSGNSWEEACQVFITHERRCNSRQLFSSDYAPSFSIMRQPDGSSVPYIDQLDFRHRQPKCILLILNAPSLEYKQYFPLTSKAFMNYMMGLPFEHRKGELFYRNLVALRCNMIKDIPVKRTYGLPLRYEGSLRMKLKRYYVNGVRLLQNRPSPMLNYYDFNSVFRNREDIKSLLINNLNDLSSRNLLSWLDIDQIKKDFFDNKEPIHEAVSTLVSLELYLKYENK